MASPWYVEIVQVSDRDKQQDLLELLLTVSGVTALGTDSDTDHYVVFECADLRLKSDVEALITDVDDAAVVVHTTRQAARPSGGGAA